MSLLLEPLHRPTDLGTWVGYDSHSLSHLRIFASHVTLVSPLVVCQLHGLKQGDVQGTPSLNAVQQLLRCDVMQDLRLDRRKIVCYN